MSDAKSNYLELKVLDHFLGTSSTSAPSAVYLSLHTSSPGEDDGNEISGNGYSPCQCPPEFLATSQ